jgi:hypothetical protein
MASGIQLRPFEVKKCPRCGETHRFALAVKSTPPGVTIFGGTQVQEIAFICQKTRQAFTQLITPEPNTEIIGPVDPSQTHSATPEVADAPSPDVQPSNDEFQDWQRSSRSIAIDFCKTMLTVATGAIPVYFAVLQYLGVAHAPGSLWRLAIIIPPVLFFGSALVFVLALRPNYVTVTEAGFTSYRQHRLQRMNTLIFVSTTMFMIAVAIAVLIFFATVALR